MALNLIPNSFHSYSTNQGVSYQYRVLVTEITDPSVQVFDLFDELPGTLGGTLTVERSGLDLTVTYNPLDSALPFVTVIGSNTPPIQTTFVLNTGPFIVNALLESAVVDASAEITIGGFAL